MVKVNLLSPEGGKIKKSAYFKFNLEKTPTIFISLATLFLLIGIFLRLVTIYQKKGLKETIEQYQEAENLVQKVNALKKQAESLNKETGQLEGYLKREVIWSEKLSRLRSLIPKEVWLTQLSSQTQSILLKGALIPQEKTSHIGTLSKFIGELKEDKVFFADFTNPILSDLRTETRQKVETMAFSLEIPFKKK